jgi:hypothetical protein
VEVYPAVAEGTRVLVRARDVSAARRLLEES